jgi:hypothetical protein
LLDAAISITNRDLPYGIDVDELFWIKQSAEDRANAVNGAAGVYAPAFAPAKGYDPPQVRWIMQ